MKWLSAGLTFVNLSTIFAVLLGLVGNGLNPPTAAAALIAGGLMAIAAYFTTRDRYSVKARSVQQIQPKPNLSKRAQHRLRKKAMESVEPSGPRYTNIWIWLLGICFAIFAARSFCWLLYIDGDHLRIQSPYNLGDLALHITYIKNLASGVAFWPDNPIYVFSKLRYPAGIDLFNALLSSVDVDLIRGLIWVGLLASVATFYAFFRWGGAFGIAAFLFNGGIASFEILKTHQWLDYEGDKTIAWKSIPLTMFVTQRGLLYAIPAGLILLWNWRERFFLRAGADHGSANERPAAVTARDYSPLPFWVELSLYASMPLFHFHTFLALSIVALCLVLFECSTSLVDLMRTEHRERPLRWINLLSNMKMSRHLVMLVGCALIPATFFVWLTTDHFHAGSILAWQPGWIRSEPNEELARGSFINFWFGNFGVWFPLVLTFVGIIALRVWKTGMIKEKPDTVAFLIPAVVIFLIGYFVRLAPWTWDNLKLMFWGYFIILPFLWRDLILEWPVAPRVAACAILFGSGFVSLFGGLAAGTPGFEFAKRSELALVGDAVRQLPVEARFAAFPTYNHPLLLQGRKLVMGYPGHLWTQGFADYAEVQNQLRDLMLGGRDWREIARHFGVRYIFWGREEDANYSSSTRPWEKISPPIKSGPGWGAIYDLESIGK